MKLSNASKSVYVCEGILIPATGGSHGMWAGRWSEMGAGRMRRTRSSPIGPAEQEDGGSLQHRKNQPDVHVEVVEVES